MSAQPIETYFEAPIRRWARWQDELRKDEYFLIKRSLEVNRPALTSQKRQNLSEFCIKTAGTYIDSINSATY